MGVSCGALSHSGNIRTFCMYKSSKMAHKRGRPGNPDSDHVIILHRIYGYRDEQEKEVRKSDNASCRHRAWNEPARRGRTFLWYVGLILNCYVI